MREIKFRGQRVDTKEWVYGDLIKSFEGIYIVESDYFKPSNDEHPLLIEVIPETIGQYTGLKDKNGVEIYEWNILIEKGTTLTCKFANGGFIFCLPSGNRLTEIDTELMRVIGNIHEQ